MKTSALGDSGADASLSSILFYEVATGEHSRKTFSAIDSPGDKVK